MTLTLPPPYLASTDTRRFNRRQTPAEQQRALGTLTVTSDALFGLGGQLIQLRDAIENRGEKIPGRTSEESLDMVNHTITVTVVAVKQMSHDHMLMVLGKCAVAAIGAVMIFGLFNIMPISNALADFAAGIL